jgi:hypothetical protein
MLRIIAKINSVLCNLFAEGIVFLLQIETPVTYLFATDLLIASEQLWPA